MKHPERELYELAEGELSGTAAIAVRAHLERCSACHATFTRLALLHTRLLAVPRLEATPAFLQAVHMRIQARPGRYSRPHWGVAGLTFGVGLLALLPSLDVLLNLFDGRVGPPAVADLSGWFAWLDQLSANVEATLVVGLCAVAVACVLVVTQTLSSLRPQVT